MAQWYSPYDKDKNFDFWKLDKPTIIGESGNTGFYSYQQ